MIKFLTLRQFICPLSLFLKEIPFASLTNAIDVKIESSNGLFDWLNNRYYIDFLYTRVSNTIKIVYQKVGQKMGLCTRTVF